MTVTMARSINMQTFLAIIKNTEGRACIKGQIELQVFWKPLEN